MYDPVELHATVDAWWHGVARAMRAEGIQGVPDKLDRSLSLDALWSAPDLLLTQTCGYPLIGAWSRQLRYLATPRYAAAGCEGATHCSWIVVAATRIIGRTGSAPSLPYATRIDAGPDLVRKLRAALARARGARRRLRQRARRRC